MDEGAANVHAIGGIVDEVILFGNSPFINTIDVPAMAGRFTIGFNGFGLHYPVDAVFCFDRWFQPGQASIIWHPAHVAPDPGCANARAYHYKASGVPLVPASLASGKPLFSFKYFTPSIALNWAILAGFKRVYLVGIDHNEDDAKFQHHDGAGCQSELTPASHRGFKKYVAACQRHIEVYQTNPAVKHAWALPFFDVERLYAVF